MSYDEQEQKRSRVVVETPNSRREVEQVHTERTPKREGYSTGMIAAVALAAIALTALLVFFLVNNNNENNNANNNARLATQATPLPRETVTVTPMQSTTTPAAQSAPIIITPPAQAPAATAATPLPTPREPDDSAIQANISKKFLDDPELASADVSASAGGGRVTLTGKVATQALKSRAEKLAQSVKGVRSVDNKITVDNSSMR